jgi:hypothetical protein
MNAPPFPDPFRSALAPSWAREKDERPAVPQPVCDAPDAANAETVRLLDAAPGQCRFPVAGEGRELLVCGARKRLGRVYCADHCRMAYLPRRQP